MTTMQLAFHSAGIKVKKTKKSWPRFKANKPRCTRVEVGKEQRPVWGVK